MEQPRNERTREVTGEELREMVNALGDDEVITVVFGEEEE